mgnify:FL=1
MTRQEFFGSLEDGQQYLSCFTTEEFYLMIPQEIRDTMLVNEIRQQNSDFDNDPTHKQLKKTYRDAKKELRNYEYKVNHKKK